MGRIIHQELRGRRKPKGWLEEEITAMRSMDPQLHEEKTKNQKKAQRKKRKK